MDWETLIEVLSENIPNDDTRAEIYKQILIQGYLEEGQDSLGVDDVFDEVWHDLANVDSDDNIIDELDFDDNE